MDDPYAERMRRLADTVLRGPGRLDAAVRQAAAEQSVAVPAALLPYVEKVARHAYRVSDDDIRALLAAGYSEDQIFEATISAALGAALVRLDAGLAPLRALEDGGR